MKRWLQFNIQMLFIIFLALEGITSAKLNTALKAQSPGSHIGSGNALEAILKFQAYDMLVDIKQNGQIIYIDTNSNNNSDNPVVLRLPLKYGDEFEFTVNKTTEDKFSTRLIAAFFIKHPERSNEMVITTNNDWSCRLTGTNNEKQCVESIKGIKNIQTYPSETKGIVSPDSKDAYSTIFKVIINKKQIRAQIGLVFDDILNSVKINNQIIDTKSYSQMESLIQLSGDLNFGDKVEICASNRGNFDYWNSNVGVISASVRIPKDNFEFDTINTSNDWKCDGNPPLIIGNNYNSSIFHLYRKNNFSILDSNAMFIWNNKLSTKTCCSITLSKTFKNNGLIRIKGKPKKIKVNSINLKVTSSLNSLYFIPADINIGDELEIEFEKLSKKGFFVSVSNGGNYKFSSEFILNNWVCDDKPAVKADCNYFRNKEFYGISPITQCYWSANQNNKIVKCKTKINRSVGYGFIYNASNLKTVKVNNSIISFTGKNNDLTSLKKVETDLGPGDKIEICVENKIDPKSKDADKSGFIAASFYYFDYENKLNNINTNSNWKCNDKQPTFKGNNSDYLYNPYSKNIKRMSFSSISSETEFIWAEEKDSNVCCSTTIEKQLPILKNNSSGKGEIKLGVDNYLKNIIINTSQVQIERNDNDDWTIIKSFKVDIKSGDEIRIVASSKQSVNPGIIASITYTDSKKKKVVVNTDLSWNCNFSQAMVKPKYNGVNCPNLTDAYWIWSSNSPVEEEVICLIKLP